MQFLGKARELSGIQLSDYFVHLDQAHPWEDNHSMVLTALPPIPAGLGEGDFKDAIGPFSAKKISEGFDRWYHARVLHSKFISEDNADAQYYDILESVLCLASSLVSAVGVTGLGSVLVRLTVPIELSSLVRGSEIETKWWLILLPLDNRDKVVPIAKMSILRIHYLN